jgi:hypothetical protein
VIKQKDMAAKTQALNANLLASFTIVAMLATAFHARAQDPLGAYPHIAPLDHYLMEPEGEITLARSAAPNSISRDAEILVLGRHGYESVGKGKNGFVCMVQRSWAAGFDDPEFWNPKLRAPICFNPAAARSYLPQIIKKTGWVLAGRSKAQMSEDLKAALIRKELPAPETGAMCFMMSKQGYLNDRDGHWHPHLMFFLPPTVPATWGADLPGSPVLAAQDVPGGLTVFLVPVGHWSDGTEDSSTEH